MRFIYATSLLLSVTSAALIRLTFTLNVEDNKSSLTVYHGIGGSLIGERCGRKYPANEAIDFSMINSSGEGNFTVGNNTYRVHQNPVFAGGPICSTEMSPPYISIHCGKLWWNITNSTLPTVEGPCFANTTQEESELDGDLDPDWNTFLKTAFFTKTLGYLLFRRKGVPNIDGSGWPHLRHLYRQVSENVHCPNDEGCSVGSSNGKTLAFGWTATANIDFIALGFTVTESYNIGSSYTCNGGPNDTVCVWYKVANTAYVGRVPDVFIPTNDCDKHSKQVLIAAPNLGNDGGGYVCKLNEECKTMNTEYWDCHGKKRPALTYCPPPGYPPKLDPNKGLLTQCVQGRASKAKEIRQRKELKAKLGKEKWKQHEKARKKREKELRKQEKARWKEQKKAIKEEAKTKGSSLTKIIERLLKEVGRYMIWPWCLIWGCPP
ncbi:uncharacterized protein FOBCDRAFT_206790 [Fusarium oxysporum Fo47]|uniref:uncharacterized protein n=1 Tax=Fusarium oxysporum Fo47 TaxID=660027 RepID=UPI00286987B1|nr:uncharacterized protein FOBCDRAFT_206790 [Fusarium oxysporum Fo47]QKD60083.2 hypothetical protein FOBCDRAFT_206790 [Fusarium oxysporum Fo47]